MLRADQMREVTVVAHEIGPFGGMESQLASLVCELLERDVHVTAIGRRIELPSHPRLCIVRLSGPAKPFPLAYLWFFAIATIAVARYRAGAVYTIGAIVLNRVDARKVPFCHAAWARSPERRSRASRGSLPYRVNAWLSAVLSRAAERIVYRPSRSGALVAMSSGGAAELDELFPAMRPARVIPNGIDLDRFAPDPAARSRLRTELGIAEDELVAIFVGGDWERKGLPIVIDALARSPRWRLIVVGEGDREEMLARAGTRDVKARITFTGRVADPERYLAGADVLAMPSRYEPWGNAVLEACACALPVVVAPAHGVADFVEPGVTGIVATPTAIDFARALTSLESAARRTELGDAARRRAARYSYAAVADDYIDLLLDGTSAFTLATPVAPVAPA